MDHEENFLSIFFSQCGSDPSNAANLVSIPQHFESEIYAENRLQKVKSSHSQLFCNYIRRFMIHYSILKVY